MIEPDHTLELFLSILIVLLRLRKDRRKKKRK